MPLRPFVLVAAALLLAACGKFAAAPNAKSETTPPQPLLISPEDVHTVASTALASGPAITGSVQPERRADLRAEVSAIVVRVLKENGDPVRRGDLLVQLDDTAFRDSLVSAEAASRASSLATEQAQRQLERLQTLRASGMASAQQLEDAEIRRNNAQSEREAARARVVLARQQLDRTRVRAPFDGVVSERKVSAGDTAQIGKELLKVIDPRSLRFEALVSADHVGSVQAGQPVRFRVNGYGDREFVGKVRRVNPTAHPTTRQVEVLVDFVGEPPRLAGLYAEGRVQTRSRASLTVPATAVLKDGERTTVYLVKDDKLRKVAFSVAGRDPRTGDYIVAEGLAEGDRVIRHPGATLNDGQPVQAAGPAKSSMAATGPARPSMAPAEGGR